MGKAEHCVLLKIIKIIVLVILDIKLSKNNNIMKNLFKKESWVVLFMIVI